MQQSANPVGNVIMIPPIPIAVAIHAAIDRISCWCFIGCDS
jgi:uncharacterized membrane protein